MAEDTNLPVVEGCCFIDSGDTKPIAATVAIVAAYAGHVPYSALGGFIASVHEAVVGLSCTKSDPVAAPAERPAPAVPIKKSVTDDYIICLENGKKFKSLKRHLATEYGLTPAEYRERWNLPKDYPMVAPAYAKARSELAKTMGLGSSRKAKTDGAVDPAPAAEEAAAS